MLNRLVSRSIFTLADRIVRPDVDHWDFHECAEPDCRACVITEDQEPGAERPDFGKCHTIDDCAHGLLSDAKVEVPPGIVSCLKIATSFEGQARFGRRCQIRCTTDQPGDIFGDGIEYLAGGFATGEPLWIRLECWHITIPVIWKLTILHSFKITGQFRVVLLIGIKHLVPRAALFSAALAHLTLEMLTHSVWHQEPGVWGPVIALLC